MIKKLCLLLMIVPLLSGCVAAAIVGGASVGGAFVYDKRSFSTIGQDRHNTEYGQTLIDHDESLKGKSHISVATYNGITLMVGQAQTEELRQHAFNLLSSHLNHAEHIYNQVTIAGSSSLVERSNDAWITTKARAVLLGAKGLRSSHIKVVTEASTIYLMGMVDRDQGTLAANAVRRVPGVKRVVKVFQYT